MFQCSKFMFLCSDVHFCQREPKTLDNPENTKISGASWRKWMADLDSADKKKKTE